MKKTVITCAPTASLWIEAPLLIAMRNRRKGTKGFTLLEILIAIVILAIVTTLVFSSFGAIFSSAEHVSAGTELFEMGNACIGRITTDLRAIHTMPYPRYQPPDIDDEPDLYRLEAEPSSIGGSKVAQLRFTSLSHLPFNQTGRDGVAEIIYYVQENQDNTLSLHRRDKLYPYPDFEPNPHDPVVCEQLLALELTFYDHDGDAHDEWNSEDDDFSYNTPHAIGIKLLLGPEYSPMEFSTRITLPTFRYKPEKRSR